MSASDGARPSPARRRLVVGAVVVLVLAAAVLAVVLSGSGGNGRADAAATGTAATSTAAPTSGSPAAASSPVIVTPEPTGPTSNADTLPPSLPAVPLDATASVETGVSAEVVSLEAIDGSGSGPGNVAGPALRATVRLTNGTADAIALDLVAVDMTYGSDQAPASPLDDPSRNPFTGSLEAGGAAEGVYVFSVPAGARDVVTLSVGYQAGAPFMVFTGSAS
jgi:hypothetical protein